MVRKIPLSGEVGKGRVVVLDDADYEKVAHLSWYLYCGEYAICDGNKVGQKTHKLMHRLILGAELGDIVDHVNGDGLDNRRTNLRITDATGNVRNRRKQEYVEGKKPTSTHKGVYFVPRLKVWCANIHADGKKYSLGYFHDEDEAGRAYDAAALVLHGEYARFNFTKDEAEKWIASGRPALPQRRQGRRRKGEW